MLEYVRPSLPVLRPLSMRPTLNVKAVAKMMMAHLAVPLLNARRSRRATLAAMRLRNISPLLRNALTLSDLGRNYTYGYTNCKNRDLSGSTVHSRRHRIPDDAVFRPRRRTSAFNRAAISEMGRSGIYADYGHA